MKLIVCVDDKFGMMFNKRRQSKDSELIKDLLVLIDGGKILINEYSRNLFPEGSAYVVDDFTQATMEDYVFVENVLASELQNQIEELIVYNWNRRYPSDFYFDIDLSSGWELMETYEFKGSSHENIRRERYKRETCA